MRGAVGPGSKVWRQQGAHHALAEQIFGTGPWQWAGHTGLVFLRGGRLVTPWGTGTWGVQRRGGAEKPPSDANVFADFGGGEHTLSVGSWRLSCAVGTRSTL